MSWFTIHFLLGWSLTIWSRKTFKDTESTHPQSWVLSRPLMCGLNPRVYNNGSVNGESFHCAKTKTFTVANFGTSSCGKTCFTAHVLFMYFGISSYIFCRASYPSITGAPTGNLRTWRDLRTPTDLSRKLSAPSATCRGPFWIGDIMCVMRISWFSNIFQLEYKFHIEWRCQELVGGSNSEVCSSRIIIRFEGHST